MKFAFAGDREISVEILKYILDQGHYPKALLVSSGKNESHAEELRSLVPLLPDDKVFKGVQFKSDEAKEILDRLELDFIFGVHFPYIIPKKILNIPKQGFLNLHPAFLPFNKGWNTPTWAILDGTPYGATLHFMSEALDEGDIVHQKKLVVSVDDTANSLYKRVLRLEAEVFKEAFPSLLDSRFKRIKQTDVGTSYYKKDLQPIREIELNERVSCEELINKLRALTTNSWEEAAFFKVDDKKKVLINIQFKTVDI